MNEKQTIKTAKPEIQRKFFPINVPDWSVRTRTVVSGLIASLGVLIYSALASAQQPVLTISNLGSNQVSVLITNGVSTTNYTLFWRQVLEDQNYPWEVLLIGDVGETNFALNVEGLGSGFFRVLLGTDFDGDGSPEWQDAQPQNPNVGILSVTIDTPLNGTTLN